MKIIKKISVIPARFRRESMNVDPRHVFGEECQVLPEKCSAHSARALKHMRLCRSAAPLHSGMTLLFICVLSLYTSLFAKEIASSFQETNQLYADGKFDEAISGYQNLLKSKKTAEIYYDLGNAYFKNKQIGKAILNYEQAKRLDPRDLDIRSNLAYANRLIEYKIEDKRSWYLRKMNDLISYFRFEECWLLFLSFYSIFLISILISFVRKRPLFGKVNSILLTFVVIASFPLLLKVGESGMNDEAIVTAKQAEVRYGPSTIDRIAFRLVEGLKVAIHDHKQDWYRIRLKDERSGWVRDTEVSVI